MPQTIDLSYALGLPPRRAIEYFQEKGYTISWNWEDTLQEAHAKAFTVAKATQLDVLESLRQGVDRALTEGQTFDRFQKNLTPYLKSAGWWGKQEVIAPDGTTQVVQLGSPHRLRTIYRTNLQTAYMVGRYQQFKENVDDRPYWQYVAVMDRRTRPAHAALNGRVFRHDDPFWDSFYPPCGFNCRCRVRALSERNLERRGLTPEVSAGKISTVERTVGRTQQEVPVTIFRDGSEQVSPDPGWSYNPGKAAWQPDLEHYDYRVARKYVEGVLTGPAFQRFHGRINEAVTQGRVQYAPELAGLSKDQADQRLRELLRPIVVVGEKYPVGVLDEEYKGLLGAQAQTAYLSDETLLKQIISRSGQDFGLLDYPRLQTVLEQAQVIIDKAGQKIVAVQDGERFYLAVVKVTQDKREVYLESFRTTTLKDVQREAKTGTMIKNVLF